MKHIIIVFLLLVFINYSKDTNHTEHLNEVIQSEKKIVYSENINESIYISNHTPYRLNIELEKLNTNSFSLNIKMVLIEGVYYISPNIENDLKGKFSIKLSPNNKLMTNSTLVETPVSNEFNLHPFFNGAIDWENVNTIYKQQFSINDNNDFTTNGLIQFVIGNRCTFEKIPFTISQQNGEIKVKRSGC